MTVDTESIKKEIEALEKDIASNDFWNDKAKAQASIKRLNELKDELLGSEKYDKGNAVLSILSGAVAFLNFDSFTYIPVQTLQKKLLGVDYVQFISVKMIDPSRERETVADIVALLRNRHDIDDPDKDDFSVTSTKEAQKTFSDVLGSLSILLLALTSISLVVGGVDI
jgi:ABC-type antimicrobial peptide transport system permease subunit